jgi:hypothetical protein
MGADRSVKPRMVRNRFNKNFLIQGLKNTIGAPDTGMLWLPFAFWRSMKIYKIIPFDVIFVTGPPFSNFIICYLISIILKKPFILDFRDAWVANPDRGDSHKTKLFFNKLYERVVIRKAHYVIANTKGVQGDFFDRYQDQVRSKFIVIPNGFDKDEILSLKKSELHLDSTKFNIVHTGSLGGIRNPLSFLTAVKQLINERKINPDTIKIHFIGLMKKFNDGKTIFDYIEQLQIKPQVRITGFIARDDAFKYMFAADVLLLIIGVVKSNLALATYGLSGKVYDYTQTGTPILSLAQKGGATFNLIKKYNIGLIANPLNINDIKNKILALYNAWLSGNLRVNYNSDSLNSHDMKKLTHKLSNLLNSSLR